MGRMGRIGWKLRMHRSRHTVSGVMSDQNQVHSLLLLLRVLILMVWMVLVLVLR